MNSSRRAAHSERMGKKKDREAKELPEGRPDPAGASPGGTEGVNADWSGGQSNIGEVLHERPAGSTAYSTPDSGDVPKVDRVSRFHCEHCGQAFDTDGALNVHRRTAHRPRA